jgi:WD40 repeat protein
LSSQVADSPVTEDQQLGCLWQGSEIISISLSGAINYWDLNQEKPVRVLYGHNKAIHAVTYDHHSKKFYSASYDGLTLQWDPATGNNVAVKGKPHANKINKVISVTQVTETAGAPNEYHFFLTPFFFFFA